MVDVSVIIPTHNRCEILQLCLRELAQQTYPIEKFEVIVVADGCSDNTVQYLEGNISPLTIKVLIRPGNGPAAARNAGARIARSDLFLFIDDDVIPGVNLLQSHVDVHKQNNNVVAVGPYIPPKPGRSDYFLTETYEFWQELFKQMETADGVARFQFVLGGNLSISKTFFDDVAGFNETLKVMEDGELGYRLLKNGAKFCYAKEASAMHMNTTDINKAVHRKFDEGKTSSYLLALHPGIQLSLLEKKTRAVKLAALAIRPGPDTIAHTAQLTLMIFQFLKWRSFWVTSYSFIMDFSFARGVSCAHSEVKSKSAI